MIVNTCSRWRGLLALVALALLVPALPASAADQGFAEDVRLFMESVRRHGWLNFRFAAPGPESRLLGSLLQRAGYPCREVVQGSVFPIRRPGGFSAEVLCASGRVHSITFRVGDDQGKLRIDGQPVRIKPRPTPEGIQNGGEG